MDTDVNAMRNKAYGAMKTAIIKAPNQVEQTINLYLISRHLERIGDHATNIAEEVIHLVKGKIVRHGI
jgi:phosphate transport system protein